MHDGLAAGQLHGETETSRFVMLKTLKKKLVPQARFFLGCLGQGLIPLRGRPDLFLASPRHFFTFLLAYLLSL